ncbi:two-component regulator propeller domain-containing protein [Mucilaginibacter paludis]|uniref:histidine kinase n=1 Tax=Mucilaginibacter paludis DSM 18603 TaxID=714943 RepID=H1Y8I8_9SPHI|nr:two-component regulator propeller domain-containing protein [Mucilaginibacter paludis]EHQ25906.1 histidine kinase [Mucilaginibacter paludis DSM 18603]
MDITKVFLCLLTYIVGLTFTANGQSANRPSVNNVGYQRYAIKTYTTHEGLPSDGTTAALKDKRGFMWIGTMNGLCRFDGYTFKNLVNIPGDSTSITSNYINALIEDRDGRIWVGTMDGLNILDPVTEKFKRFYHKDNAKGSISNNKVWSIFCDTRGVVWVGTDNGFNQYVSKTNSFIIYQPNPHDVYAMKGKSVNAIVEDQYNNLWLGNWSGGLNKFNITTRQFTSYPQLQPPNQKNPNDVWSLFYDRDANLIWVGTYWNGLFSYNPATAKYTAYPANDPENTAAYSILRADHENLIVGGDAGFYWVNTRTRLWTKIGNISNMADGSMYDDEDGIIWLCGKDGLTKVDFKQYKFNFLPLDMKRREVKSLLVNGTATWMATNNGLFRYSADGKTSRLFVHTGNPNSLTSTRISSLYQDNENRLWLTTENGFDRYDEQKDVFIHHYHHSALGSLFNEDVFRDILEVNPHEYWLATDAGLKIYNEQTNQYTHYYNDDKKPYTLSNNHLYKLMKDDRGQVWIGTYGGGLNRFNPQNKRFYAYTFNDKVKGSISNNIVHYIYQDSRKNIWICTSDGLNKYVRKTDSFVVYSVNDGFASNVFNNLVEDQQGHLWITTATGLSEFDPVKLKVKNFDEADGVYSHATICKSPSGDIYLAGNMGIVYFNPLTIKYNQLIPPVFFSDFQVFNKSVVPGAQSSLKQIISAAQDVTLKYDQSEFSIDYVALNYTHSEKNEYAYKLEGFDKKWNYVGKQRKATYTNLSPGTYAFKVIASNNDGVWNSYGKSLTIVITPPWYQTWWAYLIYVALLSGVVYTYWLYKDRQAKLRYEIKIAYIESEKEKELNEKKLSFFTNISHEFRTPLTLIINPVKELLYKDDKNVDTTNLNIVYRNARRLLSLVDQLLLFRKAESEADHLKIVKLDLVSLSKEVFLCFTHQARMKRIGFEFHANAEYLEVYADREKVEIALFNLLSNAVKFTPEGGQITMLVKDSENAVHIEVEDSGCGIPENIGEKLYNRFYQDPNNNTSLKGGFGIGLYLVKNFIERHGGTVDYKSSPEKGTTFTVALLKGTEHLEPGQFLEDTATSSVFLKELIEDESTANAIIEAANEAVYDQQLTAELKTLLVIDDNQDIREYIRQVFKLDYNIYEANNGEEGYELIKEHLPDIVISDVMMPGMSGIELCSLVKEDMAISHIPVILLTASSSPEIKLKGIEGGADDYISKPFDKEILKARVTGLLKSRNTLQQYFYNAITLNTNVHTISIEYQGFLDSCIRIVGEHLKDADFNTQMLAAHLGISYSSLYKKIKLISGQSANSFIRFIRLRKAAELFIHTNNNILETSYEVGINDIKYFREQFKKLFNMNPSQYIKKYRKTFTSDVVNRGHVSKGD